jgi:hypothetical protein
VDCAFVFNLRQKLLVDGAMLIQSIRGGSGYRLRVPGETATEAMAEEGDGGGLCGIVSGCQPENEVPRYT